jgi:ABC-type multidrug transport system fused ATPase/permease subunit
LSGGQVRRIGLARALYADGDVVLLDSPFSSLDENVARKVRNRTFALLASKITVIASSGENPTKYRLTLDATGAMEGFEAVADFRFPVKLEDEDAMTTLLAAPLTAESSNSSVMRVSVWIKLKVLFRFLSLVPFPYLACSLLLLVAKNGAKVFSTFWVSYLVSSSFSISEGQWVLGYGLAMFATVVFSFLGELFWQLAWLKCSTTAQNKLFEGFLRSAMEGSGKIGSNKLANTFTSDFVRIDRISVVFRAADIFLKFVSLIVVLAVIFPISLALLSICIVYGAFAYFYLPGDATVEGVYPVITGSMVKSMFSILGGISSIQALRQQEFFLKKFAVIANNFASMSVTTASVEAWANLCLGLINSLFMLAVCLLNLFSALGSNAGLFFLYATSVGSMMEEFIDVGRNWNFNYSFLEAATNHKQYLDLEKFREDYKERKVPQGWPSTGRIEFQKVSVSFAESLKPVIENFTATIQPGWTVGVVGRTGAGKSSLLSALLRFLPYKGEIIVDGVNVKDLGVHQLRRSLGVMLQSVKIFPWSVFQNLDPLSIHPHAAVLDLCNQAGLGTVELESFPKLSQGKLQLFCLVRALLKGSIILVEDEGSSQLNETENLVYENLCKAFASRATRLLVAHKREVILNCTKIIFLCEGKVAEFRGPSELMQKQDSLLGQMLGSLFDESEEKSTPLKCESCFIAFDSCIRKISKCNMCKLLICSICAAEGFCRFCAMERLTEARFCFKLAGRVILEPPSERSCSNCEKVISRPCLFCSKYFCEACSIFLRPFWGIVLQMSSLQVCVKCFDVLMANSLERYAGRIPMETEILAEKLHALTMPRFLLPYIKSSCSCCGKATLLSSCAVCNNFVCLSEKCSGLVYSPARSIHQYVVVCEGCIMVEFPCTKAPYVGEVSGFLALSQESVSLFDKDCASCERSFSFFREPYLCVECEKFSCRTCIKAKTDCLCICELCFSGQTDVTSNLVLTCDVCGLPVQSDELLWVNERKMHMKCVSIMRSNKQDNLCAYCKKLLVRSEAMLFNNATIHRYCLVSFRRECQSKIE